MLTCYGHTARLPHSDLVYLAFRLAVEETLSDIELQQDLEEELDFPAGYLAEVPILEQVPLQVQVDLLAETWNRHQRTELIEASLLDAAVVYAAFCTAKRIIHEMPEVVMPFLAGGPRRSDPRIIRRAGPRLVEMFDAFWDDYDFLLISDFQDMSPERAQDIKSHMNIPDEAIQPLYDALGRWHASPDVGGNLAGLLTADEIADAMPLLTRRRPAGSDVATEQLTGLDDQYHGLTVGPCDPATAATEAAECPLVVEIGTTRDDFDCSYEEWLEHLRGDVQRAMGERDQRGKAFEWSGDIMKKVYAAMTDGLEDGTRIEQWQGRWIVVDRHGFFLHDPNDTAWVADVEDEDLPAMLFASPEEAYAAWLRSCQSANDRMQRREAALRRLGRG